MSFKNFYMHTIGDIETFRKKKKKNNIVVVPPSHLGVVLLELASPGSVNFVTVKSGTYSVDPGSRSKRLPPSHLGDVLL